MLRGVPFSFVLLSGAQSVGLMFAEVVRFGIWKRVNGAGAALGWPGQPILLSAKITSEYRSLGRNEKGHPDEDALFLY